MLGPYILAIKLEDSPVTNDRVKRMGFLAIYFLIFLACEIYVLLYAFSLLPLRPFHTPLILGGFAGLYLEQLLEPDWLEKLTTKTDFSAFRNPLRSLAYPLTIEAARFSICSLILSISLFTVLTTRFVWLVFTQKPHENPRQAQIRN